MTPEELDRLSPQERDRAVVWLENNRPHAFRTLGRLTDSRFTVTAAERDALRRAVAQIPTGQEGSS